MGVKKYIGTSAPFLLKYIVSCVSSAVQTLFCDAQKLYFRCTFPMPKLCTFGAHLLYFRRSNIAFPVPIYCIFGAHFATEPKNLLIDSEPEAIRSHRRRRLALYLQRMKNATITFATVRSGFSANEFFTVGKVPKHFSS